jgi:hypothetical protein
MRAELLNNPICRSTLDCRCWMLALCTLFTLALGGCGFWRSQTAESQDFAEMAGIPVENPLFIPAHDREFLWNQIVDEMDNYFHIQREERVRVESGVLTEGRIETRPQSGATLLEPWRGDSTSGYERWHSTLQTIRRTGNARVIPVENGYLLNLMVFKELEDVDKPVQASAGAVIQRHDNSLVREEVPPGTFSITPGWIPLGRDVSLEQRMLANLRSRLCNPNLPTVKK